jgi:CubicO group peptidase (beta-lactamase class C family)
MKQHLHRAFPWGLLFAFALPATHAARGQVNPNPSPALDAIILDEMDLERLPGVSTIIVKNGQIVWVQSYGFADVPNAVPVTDSTAFLLASIAKVFTGTAAMQLVESNTLDLDGPVNSHLPWSLQIPAFPAAPVTVRQLMTHSSSIQDNYTVMDTYYDQPDPSISLADCMERYFATTGEDHDPANNFLSAAPGTAYEYANIATALNGYVVELAGGMPFDQYCNAHIFEPLCMGTTAWYLSDFDSAQVARPHRYMAANYVPYAHYGFADYPSGQLRSNVLDLANFMIAYLNGGTLGTSTILAPGTVQEMLTPQVPGLDPTQGLNWYTEEIYHSGGTSWLWGHNGGEYGASTDLYLDPVNNIGICVLANGEGDGIYICDALYDFALSPSITNGITPACATVGMADHRPLPGQRHLIKVVDTVGRETELRPNVLLVKMYSDGSAERVFIME